ncbi:MAG: ABC transporter permease subunit [Gammaproteobacteria bacterium]|nr:MAG: ABC transporter permease subunit [Gammaproteobacteria bacterium]
MTAYFIRRFLLIIPTFIGVTLLVFAITRMVPGGPIERMISEMQLATSDLAVDSVDSIAGNTISDEQIQELREYYGFDKPILVSYYDWMKKVVQLDLGTSSRYDEPVIDIIVEKLPVSIFYGVTTLLLSYLICVPLGIIKAVKHTSYTDNLSSIVIFIGYAIPGYVLGIGLMWAFAVHYEVFPMGGFISDDFDDFSQWEQVVDVLYHAVLPLLSYMVGSLAVMTLMMKNSLLDNLAADYVRTAMAKGLSFRQAVLKHAFRNSFIPLATHIGNGISVVLAGSFLIEKIFNIDGIGLFGYESIVDRDYPSVLGILVISSLLFMVGNILSDICVAIVDPRVQFGKEAQ